VKDSELTAQRVADHDLIVIGTLDDNYLFHHVPADVPVRLGRNHFEWRGEQFTDPNDGLFLVVPNPFNAKRVMYVIAANSALELYQMTKQYTRDIPSWAVFHGGEVKDKGYHPVREFQMDTPNSPAAATTDTHSTD